MTVSTEHVVSEVPFVVRRRVKFGECDPAGVVYTPWFSEYVLSAAELFYGALFKATGEAMKSAQAVRTPTRALEFEFLRTLRPDDDFDMTVSVREIRTRSYVLAFDARKAAETAFRALLTPVCVDRDALGSIPIPPAFRAALEAYRGQS